MPDVARRAENFAQDAAFGSDARAARKLELGLIGMLLGGGEEKAGNFATLAFFCSLIALTAVVFFLPSDDPAKQQTITALTSVVTGSLGFALGKKS